MPQDPQSGAVGHRVSALQPHELSEDEPFLNRWQAHGAVMVCAVFAFLCVTFLFDRLLRSNDSLTLPWALQFVEPNWLPNDWLLNSPVGNQLLTATGIGWLIKEIGFLQAALVSRLVAYGLLAAALTALVRKLHIPLGYTIVGLWLFAMFGQSIAASEWIFGPAESKVFAYACVFFGLSFLVEKRLVPAYACLGLATSLHFLVGGYALCAALLVAIYDGISIRTILVPLAGYALFSAVGTYNVASEIVRASGVPDVSHIIAYRFPHHMVPATWDSAWWWRLPLLGAGWIAAYGHTSRLEGPRRLLLFGAFTMVPFVGGLLVAPFDHRGIFLKYYPFRMGASLFPFIVILGGYFVLQRWVRGRVLAVVLTLALTILMTNATYTFARQVRSFKVRPDAEPAWVEACTWIREMTPRAAVILAPPARPSFTLLAQRAMVVQFKFFPFTQAEVLEWHRRLLDLTGGRRPRDPVNPEAELNEFYFQLTDVEIARLAQKYGADYVLTRCDESHKSALVFSTKTYCVYKPEADVGL
jgi:hypothetical protein